MEEDKSRTNWDGSASRPLAWSAWYPTYVPPSVPRISEEGSPFFTTGEISFDTPIVRDKKFPLVLLSHGTGGSPESLGWLARYFAERGVIVIGAHHHGNTGREPYRAEGFLCWWERAKDLSVLLSVFQKKDEFAEHLNKEKVTAIGFSLGGYTALALSGARTDVQLFEAWVDANFPEMRGPREFPDAAGEITRLMMTSEPFRKSWERQNVDYSDKRIEKAVAIAPAPPVRAFTSQSVRDIDTPITLITGGADIEAPTSLCADWLVQQNPNFAAHDVGKDVGHYTFLDFPFNKALWGKEDLFMDNLSVDRKAVHEMTAKLAYMAVS